MILLIIYVALVYATFYGSNFVSIKKELTKKQTLITSLTSVALAITTLYFFHTHNSKLYGTQIGSLFESGDYVENYYVNLFEGENASKNYRVEAEIFKAEGEYFLYSITWPNGGYTTFDSNGWVNPLFPFEKVELEDDDGKAWFVELTKERVGQ